MTGKKKNFTLYKLIFILFLNSFSILDTVHVLAEPEILEMALSLGIYTRR